MNTTRGTRWPTVAMSAVIGMFALSAMSLPAKTDVGLIELCNKIDCAFLCLSPKIKDVLFFSNITPGGTVVVKGCGFGSTKGSFRLVLVDYKGNNKPVWLDIIDWTDTLVSGTIPSLVSQVKDQSAKLKIVTDNNIVSNEKTVFFRATQDIKLLPMSDVSESCSTEADHDWCNGNIASNSPFCLSPFGGAVGKTASGRHYTCHDPFGGDNGTDAYLAVLKNGWILHSMDWSEQNSCLGLNDDESQAHPYGFKAGGSQMILFVDWITCYHHGLVMYDVNVFIKGPVGVPHS
jgi:hypothetical protein